MITLRIFFGCKLTKSFPIPNLAATASGGRSHPFGNQNKQQYSEVKGGVWLMAVILAAVVALGFFLNQ